MEHKLTKTFSKFEDLGLLVFRFIFAFSLFYGHGLPKLERLLSGNEIKFPDPLGLGTEVSFYLALFAEVLCTFLLMIGLMTRLSLIPIIITMATIVFVVDFGMPFKKFELAFIYLIGFVVMLILGPGRYSVDTFVFRNKLKNKK